jgi:hypothetical protein
VAEIALLCPASFFIDMALKQPVLAVDPKGDVNTDSLDIYLLARRMEVGKRLQACLASNDVAMGWLRDLSADDLYEQKDGETKYLGDTLAEADATAALERVKAAADPVEMVSAVEDLIMCFCGFSIMKPFKAKCLINAVHFQYDVDINRLLSASLPLPSSDGALSDVKVHFDDARVCKAELLLRCVVETADGGSLANPFSPGMPMGKLIKLPLFAQFVMVLINTVEAIWYEDATSNCPMAINVYASLLVAGAPVMQMTEGAHVVEVMEMTKGAKRGPEVDEWVDKTRENGAQVLLDDFDAKHPGIGSTPDGIKVCVFVNAFHSLQAFKNEPVGPSAALLPITEAHCVEKERANPNDLVDYYGLIVPKHQSGARILIMEGSENCLKSEVQGPPLNFGEPNAAVASAHVYQAAARALCANKSEGQPVQMLHQGGRALYDDEDFDEDAHAVIEACGKKIEAARTSDAGTIAWIGTEAVRRAAMQQRPLVCGIAKRM